MTTRALLLDPLDNTATLLEAVSVGEAVAVGDRTIRAAGTIPFGHKVALRAIAPGEPVLKYGQPIGLAVRLIAPGEHVHTLNVEGQRGRGDRPGGAGRPGQGRAAGAPLQASGTKAAVGRHDDNPVPGGTFEGYRRADGRVGLRNHVAVLASCVCSSLVAARIAASAGGAVPLTHQHGCCQIGEDYELTRRVLIGLGQNPNVGAVLVVALGCEGAPFREIAAAIRKTGKPVDLVVIQEVGGTSAAIADGLAKARRLAEEAGQAERGAFSVADLIVGLECGGSDATSGLAANPALGWASDWFVTHGATTILSETTEVIGAEHLLARRAKDPQVRVALLSAVERMERRALAAGCDIRATQPTPGNLAAGLTTLEEKSLGCLYKAGDATLQGVLGYGEAPPGKGLYFMDTPGQDIESVTAYAAAGVQVVLFTTGLGTPTGCPILPVIKVTANAQTAAHLAENIDVDLSGVLTAGQPLPQAGAAIVRTVLSVAGGELTRSERIGATELALPRLGPTL
jgi:altronate dehydratase large subunit